MRILFFVGHDGFLRNFEPVVRGLADKGHHVHLAMRGRRQKLMAGMTSIESIAAEHPTVTFDRCPDGHDEAFADLSEALQGGRDFLRYLAPEYRDAPKLRERAAEHAPPVVRRVAGLPGGRRPSSLRCLDAAMVAALHVAPTSSALDAYVAGKRPDVALFTPLLGFRSTQYHALRSAKRAGVPTALLVHSWDNLTNKGILHELPDRIMVWNEAQADEAVRLHGAPRNSVVITGAQNYDRWFSWHASTSKPEFCAAVGLDPERPILLYLCSSKFIAPDEADWIARWVRRLRATAATSLRDVAILVRPHPQHLEQWADVDFGDPGRTVVWPRDQDNPVDSASRSRYFDSLFHSRAVVGINTSALIEAAIVGRRTYTLLAPEYRDTQQGTLHFQHLTSHAEEGILRVAHTFREHAEQLDRALLEHANPDAQRPGARFVASFVRPNGIDRDATPQVVDAVELLANVEVDPRRRRLWHPLAACALTPLVHAAGRVRVRADAEKRRRKALS